MTTTVIRTIPLSASALTVYFGTFERLAYLLSYIDVKDAITVLVAWIAAKLAPAILMGHAKGNRRLMIGALRGTRRALPRLALAATITQPLPSDLRCFTCQSSDQSPL